MPNSSTGLANNLNSDDESISLKVKIGVSSKTLKQFAVMVSLGLSLWGGFEIANRQKQSQIQTQNQTQIANCSAGQGYKITSPMSSSTTPIKPSIRQD
ncbi:hypothetical protein IQ244_29535 [Nostoc sp. LEGE 06077]|uniref:hypothetical protein n=1 Tax=Nostoc sp. LEGE 06077 TaxID=915325 RepID=UPI00188041E7|nr:hypothetical protein [Nostoc sp. LEGE 06077]MBE9210572.1 hypothetical protein [Nostoc sp. LEGE 06077]